MVSLFPEPLPEVRLIGARVALRPPVKADYPDWAEVRGRSRGFLEPWEPAWAEDALSRAAWRRRLRRAAADWRADQGYAFHVLPSGGDQMVGAVTLSNVRRGVAQTCSMGYWIGEPWARQGLMTEAVGLALRFAFEQASLHRVEAACLPTNLPSRKLLARLGFTQEGVARKLLRIAGRWEDHLQFALLAEDRRK
jgi:ribosomal-protein-alanine N-acetyltransferase